MSVLIDCANFYRALQDSISKAKTSIFILGWEIDSGTHLLRGSEERESKIPSKIVDLLANKAKENPALQVYLVRWDASVAFPYDRELMPEGAWTLNTPANVSIFVDNMIPLGGSHHQKIILIDDELVFTGGMDIARERWDERHHDPEDILRTDFRGPYRPYHDVQVVMDGPITQVFSQIVRWRWSRVSGYEAWPAPETKEETNSEDKTEKLGSPVACWPSDFPPQARDILCAVARTLPEFKDEPKIQEVQSMYLAIIQNAQEFIYIENQFLTCLEIARALNQRLKEKSGLRIILISSYDPQGFLEQEGLWAERIQFRSDLTQGISNSRFLFVCTGMTDRFGKDNYKRIHSKVFIVDDHHLVVASSNLNNRSMALDTECDVIFQSDDTAGQSFIAQTRNDLLGEHCGRNPQEVAQFLAQGRELSELLEPIRPHAYHLREINDSQFTQRYFKKIAQRIADPKVPLINLARPWRNPKGHRLLFGLAVFISLSLFWYFMKESIQGIGQNDIQLFLERSRASDWALPLVCLAYVVGGFIFFPVTLLSLLVAGVFGPIRGPVYGLIGSLLSAAVMFGIGNWVGSKGLRNLLGGKVQSIDHHLQKSGVLGVILIRLVPIAPFSLVNLAAGISSIRFGDFLLGSFLAFIPFLLVKGVLGDSMLQVLLNPSRQNIYYLILGFLLWIGVAGTLFYLTKIWKRRVA